jgi:tRNA uridine 5-carbamoylmethylation protein Kti12
MAQLLICRGLPGSGKTYWAKQVLQEYAQEGARGRIMRSNRDEYRGMLLDSEYEPGSDPLIEDIVTVAQHSGIVSLLLRDIDVICDDTNLDKLHIMALATVASNADADYRVVDFNTRLIQCVARDRRRNEHEQVGERVIHKMYDKYLAPYGGQLPNPANSYGVAEIGGRKAWTW